MIHARLNDAPLQNADPENFTLPASRHNLITVADPPSTAVVVRFGAGGRTHWHRHPSGQYIYVIEGEGRLAGRDGNVATLLPGDTVFTHPYEEHWHGASTEQGVVHLALSFGETEWLGPVDGA